MEKALNSKKLEIFCQMVALQSSKNHILVSFLGETRRDSRLVPSCLEFLRALKASFCLDVHPLLSTRSQCASFLAWFFLEFLENLSQFFLNFSSCLVSAKTCLDPLLSSFPIKKFKSLRALSYSACLNIFFFFTFSGRCGCYGCQRHKGRI